MQGAFGFSSIEIESWVAGHPPGGGPCRGYVSGITMTVTFSEPTNKALMDGKISRDQVDILFAFRWNMGQDYSGEWLDDKSLVITIHNPFGASPPEIGFIVGQVNIPAFDETSLFLKKTNIDWFGCIGEIEC